MAPHLERGHPQGEPLKKELLSQVLECHLDSLIVELLIIRTKLIASVRRRPEHAVPLRPWSCCRCQSSHRGQSRRRSDRAGPRADRARAGLCDAESALALVIGHPARAPQGQHVRVNATRSGTVSVPTLPARVQLRPVDQWIGSGLAQRRPAARSMMIEN